MNLSAVLEQHAISRPSKGAIVSGSGTCLTYAEFHSKMLAAARELAALGVSAGHRVAWLGRNDPSQLVLFAACARLGAVASPLNWRLTPGDLAIMIADLEPTVLLASASNAGAADMLRQRFRGFTMVQCAGEDLLAPAAEILVRGSAPLSLRSCEGDVLLCFTSGSSGQPKGVRITHSNLLAGWHQAITQPDWAWTDACVSMCALPLFHIAGLRAALLALLSGGTCAFPLGTTAREVLRCLAEHRVTKFMTVPTLLSGVIQDPSFCRDDLSALETVFYGGAPIASSLLAMVSDRLSCDLVQIYGLTETTGGAFALGPLDHRQGGARMASCGKPLPGVELRLEPDARAPEGEAEVWLRSATVAAGYWRHEVGSQHAFGDGWFRTGDVGSQDESGYLYLRGRMGDVIKSGGEKVVPGEVENALVQHPAVLEAAVVGIPDEQWGERVVAAVVLRPGTALDPKALLEHCRGKLAGYKHPKQFVSVVALPRNANGKLIRGSVQALVLSAAT